MLRKTKTSRMDFAELMDAFSKKAGLDPFIPDEKGRYILELNNDDRPIFCFKTNDRTGTVYGSVVTMQPDSTKHSDLILELLSGFTAFIKSRHDVMCLDQQSHDIVLFRRFSLTTLTAEHFYAIIEDFVNSLCAFRKLAASCSTAGPAAIAGRRNKPRMTLSALRA